MIRGRFQNEHLVVWPKSVTVTIDCDGRSVVGPCLAQQSGAFKNWALGRSYGVIGLWLQNPKPCKAGTLKRLSQLAQTISHVSTAVYRGAEDGQIQIGSGPEVVVLVHGFGLNSKSWIPFVLPHIKNQTFVAVDLPGHGTRFDTTPDPDSGYLEQFSKAILHAIDKTGAEKVALVGYSIGAFACLQYFKTFGTARVSKYLHIDHSPFPGSGWQGAMHPELHDSFEAFLSRAAGSIPDVQDQMHFSQVPADVLKSYYSVLEKLSDLSLNNPSLRAADRFFKQMPWLGESAKQVVSWPWAVRVIEGYHSERYDFRATLEAIDIPTWVMGSKENKLFPLEAMQYMAEHIPNAQLHSLSGGHEMQFGSPIKFHRIFKNFLSQGHA